MKVAGDGSKDFDFDHELPPGPFRHAVTVGWGDADPAQIAYTANIPAWCLEALEAWMKACTGVGWYEMNIDLGVGTPFVDIANSFQAPITPRQPLLIEVTVARIGRSSLACALEGFQEPAGRCFSGRYTCAFVDSVRVKPIAIPKRMRANIARFATAQGRPLEDGGAS